MLLELRKQFNVEKEKQAMAQKKIKFLEEQHVSLYSLHILKY